MVRGKWVLFAATVVLIGVGAGAVTLLRREAAARKPAAPRAPAPPPPAGEFSLPAVIRAQHVVPAGAQVSGEIQEFFAEPGEDVFEGQPLARIVNLGLQTAHESASAANDLAQSRVNKLESSIIAARMEASRARADAHRSHAELERTDKFYRRQKTLLAEGATPRLVYEKSEKEFLSAKSEYDSLDALAKNSEERVTALLSELDNARKALDDKMQALEDAKTHLQAAEIQSPATGLVVARRGEVGKTINPGEGQDLFEIAVDLSALQAVVDLDPSAAKRVEAGDAAMVYLADVPGEGIAGAIKEVAGGQVIVDFVSPTTLIKPGMSAQVKLRLR